jgi:predicted phage terminase large subunit-like protein
MVIDTYTDLNSLPPNIRVYGASDYATMAPEKGKKEPDFTEHGVWAIDQPGNLFAIDWWWKQCETDESIAEFIKLVGIHKPAKWANEGGLIDKAIGPTIRRAMRDNRKFVAIEPMPSLQDKGMKLQAFHARVAAHAVYFPVRRKFTEHVIEQLIKFPAGRWDDAADVCGLIGRMIDQMADPNVPVVERKPDLVPFTAKWLEFNDGRDKPKMRFF